MSFQMKTMARAIKKLYVSDGTRRECLYCWVKVNASFQANTLRLNVLVFLIIDLICSKANFDPTKYRCNVDAVTCRLIVRT